MFICNLIVGMFLYIPTNSIRFTFDHGSTVIATEDGGIFYLIFALLITLLLIIWMFVDFSEKEPSLVKTLSTCFSFFTASYLSLIICLTNISAHMTYILLVIGISLAFIFLLLVIFIKEIKATKASLAGAVFTGILTPFFLIGFLISISG